MSTLPSRPPLVRDGGFVTLPAVLAIGQQWNPFQGPPHPVEPGFPRIRLCFGSWLILALEFQLAADILATTVAPSKEELIRLAIIAVIRTFLNYFLGKELDAQTERQRPEPVRLPSRPDAR